MLSPASATISAGGRRLHGEGFDSLQQLAGRRHRSTTFTIAPTARASGPSCTATVAGPHTITGTNAAHRDRVAAGRTERDGPHRVSPSTATITPAGRRATPPRASTPQQLARGRHLRHDVHDRPDGSCTAATCTATTSGPHTVTANDSGKTSTASLSVRRASLDHSRSGPRRRHLVRRVAGVHGGGPRPVRQLARATSLRHDVHDRPDGSCTAATCTASPAGPHRHRYRRREDGTASLERDRVTVDHIVISPATARSSRAARRRIPPRASTARTTRSGT